MSRTVCIRFLFMHTPIVPIVQFTKQRLSATEPLSDYFIDSKSVVVTLVRTGDTELIVAVQYSLIDGTAVGGVDYTNHTVHGIITF